MRQTLFSIALLLFTSFAFGQKHRPIRLPGSPTKAEEAKANMNFQCLHTNKYTANERRSFFPFSIGGKIKLISFEGTRLPDPVDDANGELVKNDPNTSDTVALITPLAPGRFVLNQRKVIEDATLDTAGINSLTDILYNVGYTPVKNSGKPIVEFGACYNPRNAVMFFDASGHLTQYIEFCFQCKGYFYSSSKTRAIEYCEQKYDLIGKFFISQGLKYGTL